MEKYVNSKYNEPLLEKPCYICGGKGEVRKWLIFKETCLACKGSGSLPCLKSNNYFFGRLLTADDFKAGQEYLINKNRLINRLIFGAGVIVGLKVLTGLEANIDAGSIRVEKGVALDCCGREILLPDKEDISVRNEVEKKYPELIDGKSHELYIYIKYSSRYTDVPILGIFPISVTDDYEIGVSKNKPNPNEIDENICHKWENFVESPEEYEFLVNRCLECFEDRVLVLAKITISNSNDSVIVDSANNAVGANLNYRRLVYSNECLYKLIECLRIRADMNEDSIKTMQTLIDKLQKEIADH